MGEVDNYLNRAEDLKLSSLFEDTTSVIGNRRILAMRAWGRRIFTSKPRVSRGGYSVRSALVLNVLRKFTVSAVF
jgi:hypothetical protein